MLHQRTYDDLNAQPDIAAIRAAQTRIEPYIHRTPVMTCASLDRLTGARLTFKCENLQQAGAFKSRGACNAVFSLGDAEAAAGVVTHSSGNHAAALARAAGLRGIPAYVVMPSNSNRLKIAAVRDYGGQITLCEPTLAAREQTAARVQAETGATLIHPYDDYRIIAGQATAAVELLEDAPELDVILAPVGGGGLLSGTLLAAKALRPAIEVFGCEPQTADDAYRSFHAGRLIPLEKATTIADGLRTSLGERTWPIIAKHAADILLASEAGIASALRLLMERLKLVFEPSAAVPLAALLENPNRLPGKRIGILLSGGNVDFDTL